MVLTKKREKHPGSSQEYEMKFSPALSIRHVMQISEAGDSRPPLKRCLHERRNDMMARAWVDCAKG
jgi:hypothetical protein